MSDIQQDDIGTDVESPVAGPESGQPVVGKIYEDENYVVNDEGIVVVAGIEEVDPEQAKKDAKAKLPEIHISEVASVTCQADLDRILADHLEWAYAVLNPKADTAKGRANLIGADLRNYNLSGKNLSGADLSKANLQGCEMINCNLTATNFEGADMRCVNLRGSKLVRTKLTGTDLRGADLTNIIMMGVDLTTAITRSSVEETSATADGELKADVDDSSLADTPLFNNAAATVSATEPCGIRRAGAVAASNDSEDFLTEQDNAADTAEHESDIMEATESVTNDDNLHANGDDLIEPLTPEPEQDT